MYDPSKTIELCERLRNALPSTGARLQDPQYRELLDEICGYLGSVLADPAFWQQIDSVLKNPNSPSLQADDFEEFLDWERKVFHSYNFPGSLQDEALLQFRTLRSPKSRPPTTSEYRTTLSELQVRVCNKADVLFYTEPSKLVKGLRDAGTSALGTAIAAINAKAGAIDGGKFSRHSIKFGATLAYTKGRSAVKALARKSGTADGDDRPHR